MTFRVPVAEPTLGDSEKRAVVNVIASGHISQGTQVQEFEQRMADYIGVKYAVACHSGTCANEMMVAALSKPTLQSMMTHWDRYVAVPACTSVAVVNPLLYAHFRPRFYDLDGKLCINIENLGKRHDSAILYVYAYGSYPERFEKLLEHAEHIPLFEDACVAYGGTYQGRKLGSFGLASSISFYVNKLITASEGGMVLTNDESFATYCREYVNHGRKHSEWHDEWYYHHLGRNAKMTDLQAAIGLAQLERIQDFIDARRKICWELHGALKGDQRYDCILPNSEEVPWMFWIVNWDRSVDMREKAQILQRKYGIETRPTLPYLPNLGFYEMPIEPLPVALASQNGFLVSCSPAVLLHGDLNYLKESMSEVLDVK